MRDEYYFDLNRHGSRFFMVDIIWGTFSCSVTSVIGYGIASEVMNRFA
jgi:uncharacterized membrane protein